MPTSAKFGGKGRILISSDGGSTFNDFVELRDAELSVDTDMVEVTNHQSLQFKEHIDGNTAWEITGEANYVETDAAQSDIRSAILGHTGIKVKFRPDVGSGLKEFTGDARVRRVGIPIPNDSQIVFPIELQGTGVLTEATQ